MQPAALRTLEFDRIVDAVCRFAQTPTGAVRLQRMRPHVDAVAVSRALAATSETARFLADNHIGLQAPSDLEGILAALAVEGRALEASHLLALASFLSSIETTCGAVRRARTAFSILRGIADGTAAFEQEIADIRRKIDPSGEVSDGSARWQG